MRVTYTDEDSEVTIEPVVQGPKTILYDYTGRALQRRIGFVDNRPVAGIDSGHKTK